MAKTSNPRLDRVFPERTVQVPVRMLEELRIQLEKDIQRWKELDEIANARPEDSWNGLTPVYMLKDEVVYYMTGQVLKQTAESRRNGSKHNGFYYGDKD